MKKTAKYVGLFLLSMAVGAAFAQTSVTATVTDADSQTWNSGTFSAQLIPAAGTSGPFYFSGAKVTTPVSGTMNGSGALSVSLDPNASITPAGTQWQFTLCPNASAPCQTQPPVTIVGASQDISTQLSTGLKAVRFAAIGVSSAYGYADGEVNPTPNPGGSYYNVTTPACRLWNGTAWTSCSGSSGSGTVSAGTTGEIPYYTATGTTVGPDPNLTTDGSGDLTGVTGTFSTSGAGPTMTVTNTSSAPGTALYVHGTNGATGLGVVTTTGNAATVQNNNASQYTFESHNSATGGTAIVSAGKETFVTNSGGADPGGGNGITGTSNTTTANTIAVTEAVNAVGANTNCIAGDGTGGIVSASGACGTGTVNSGTANQLAYYSATGAAVSGDSAATDNGTTLTYTGTGGVSAAKVTATGSGAGNVVLTAGTAPSTTTNSVTVNAPATVTTAYLNTLPGAPPTTASSVPEVSTSGVWSWSAGPPCVLSGCTMTGAATINMGSSNAPGVDITSSATNGAALYLDNSSGSGNSEDVFSNGSKNFGIYNNSSLRDVFICVDNHSGPGCGGYHVQSFGAAPTIAAGTGAGSSPTLAFVGTVSDNAGQIQLTTGTTPTGTNATIATVTFAQPWYRTTASGSAATAYIPSCTFSAANANSAALTSVTSVYLPTATTSAFTLVSGTTALTAATQYNWSYKCE